MYVCIYVCMYGYMYDILVLVAVLNHPLRQGKPEIVPASSEASQFDIFSSEDPASGARAW